MKEVVFWRRLKDYAGRTCLLAGKTVRHHARHLLTRGTHQKRYVFVAGMQRSGTNMLMDVLEKSHETDVYHERDPRAFDNYRMKERQIIHGLAARSRAPVFIIKALCELQELRSLMDEFAPARALWVVRDYRDVVNSMLVSFRNQAKEVQRVAEDRKSCGWLGEGMSDETHELLRTVTHAELSNASGAALQWYFRNQLFFDQGLDRDPRVLVVKYESLVSDPMPQFKRVFDFLGLGFTPRVAGSVFASSVHRRNPPDIEARVCDLCEGLDRRFDRVLAAAGDAGA